MLGKVSGVEMYAIHDSSYASLLVDCLLGYTYGVLKHTENNMG